MTENLTQEYNNNITFQVPFLLKYQFQRNFQIQNFLQKDKNYDGNGKVYYNSVTVSHFEVLQNITESNTIFVF